MDIWFTADPHFGHRNPKTGIGIIDFCQRPFKTIEEMDEVLIENWNKDVKCKDTVYIVGDFAWRNHNHYLMAVKGKKTLIRGNHDKMSQECLKNFTDVFDLKGITIDGKYIVLCHYPLRSWNGKMYKSWNLYGHCHGRLNDENLLALDVGVDCWGYKPVNFETIRTVLDARQQQLTEDRLQQWAKEETNEDQVLE